MKVKNKQVWNHNKYKITKYNYKFTINLLTPTNMNVYM